MQFIRPLAVTLALASTLAMAQDADKSKKKAAEEETQTQYILRRAPMGLISMPGEAIYRLTRTLKIHQWDQMMEKKVVKQILSKTNDLRTPKAGNVFPFQNFSEDFEGVVDREFGVCSGFSTLQRNFNILMQFDPQNLHKANIPSKEKNIIAYYDFYKRLITRASHFHPVIIPGFKNLNEFLTDPYLQVHAKKEVVKMWAKNNATIQGIEQFANANQQFPKKKWKTLYNNLKKRLDAGYNPIVYSSFNPTDHIKYNIHVIQIMGVSEYRADGTFEIFIWDDGVLKDHFGEFKAEKLVKVMTFRADGAIWWLESDKYLNLPFSNPDSPEMMDLREKELIDETLWINILPNDDRVMTKVIHNKAKWCASKKEYMQYCK